MKKNSGIILLTNSKIYPFNDSMQTIALDNPFKDVNYNVNTEILKYEGETGELIISGKARNGFKIAYTGSATQTEVYWEAVQK